MFKHALLRFRFILVRFSVHIFVLNICGLAFARLFVFHGYVDVLFKHENDSVIFIVSLTERP